MWMFVRRFVLIALIAAGLGAGAAVALDATRTIHQLTHTAWGIREDGPVDTWSFAQTRDGLLWIGTTDGLFTFDGVAFRRAEDERGEPVLQGENINTLFVASNGDLWTGSSVGSIARLRNCGATQFSTASGHILTQFAEDREGGLWAAFGGGEGSLLRFDGEHWREAPFGWAHQSGAVSDLMTTQDGTFWVAVDDTIVFLRPGAQRFVETGLVLPTYARLEEGPDGRIWIAVGQFGVVSIERAALMDHGPRRWRLPTPDVAIRPRRIMFDADGVLWASSWTEGLFRVRVERNGELGVVERFRAADGLTSDLTMPLFEDREGNIWVGSHLGVDRFRPANIVTERSIAAASRIGFFAARADAETLVLASETNLYVARADRPTQLLARLDDMPTTMCGREGRGVWVATYGDMLHFNEGRLTRAPRPPTDEIILSCTIDPAGALWVSAAETGLFRLTAGAWRRYQPSSDLATTDGAVVADEQGRLWIADFHSAEPRLFRAQGERVEAFLGSRGPQIGRIQVIDPRADYVLIGGARGLARYDGRRFQRLNSRLHPALSSVSGIARAADGSTWLSSIRGVTRIEERDLQAAFANPEAPLRARFFDRRDGLPAGAVQDSASNSAVRGPDGRIWFMTKDGVAWADPERLVFNRLAPPVSVTNLRAGGQEVSLASPIVLVPGTSDIEIDYAGLSLQIPERVAYRYLLEGVDRDWVEAGPRRQAFYTELGPGEYRFRVRAANNDGVWNEEGAVLTFTILPTFVQSIWFKFLVGLAILGLMVVAYAFRVRHVTTQLQSRFNARIAERERIARELHDTLLQGFQGLLLRFQSIANRLPAEDQLRSSLDEALDRADAVLVEGRARVRDLRATAAGSDLAKAIIEIAHKTIDSDTPRFQLTVEGSARELHVLVHEEVTRIAEEAIRNAVQHAGARAIETILSYGAELRLAIRDDGAGMPASILTSGEKADHYGLVGMRERTRRIGGRLNVTSRERAGTEIALSIPARAAYKHRRGRLFDWFWRLRSRSSE